MASIRSTSAALVAVAALAGCSLDGYSDEAVEQVGESSTELDRFVRTYGSSQPRPVEFKGRQRSIALQVFQGDLEGVTPADIRSLYRVQLKATARSRRAFRGEQQTSRELQRLSVDVGSLDVSDAVKEFVEDYNDLIAVARNDSAQLRDGYRTAVKLNREFERWFRALVRGMKTGDFAEAERSRRATVRLLRSVQRSDLQRRSRGTIRNRMNEAAKPLVDLANDEPDVSDFIEAVQDDYPDSVFHSIFRRRR